MPPTKRMPFALLHLYETGLAGLFHRARTGGMPGRSRRGAATGGNRVVPIVVEPRAPPPAVADARERWAEKYRIATAAAKHSAVSRRALRTSGCRHEGSPRRPSDHRNEGTLAASGGVTHAWSMPVARRRRSAHGAGVAPLGTHQHQKAEHRSGNRAARLNSPRRPVAEKDEKRARRDPVAQSRN